MAGKQAITLRARAPRRTVAGSIARRIGAATLAATLAFVLAAAPGPAAPAAPAVETMRAVWLEARPADLATASGRAALLARARAMRADTIFVEVWTAGHVIYASRNVPTAAGFTGQDADDPVRGLLDEARRDSAARLRVVAVLDPLRLGETSADAAGLAAKHADWLTQDAAGAKADAEKSAWLDPGLPAVQDFAAAATREFLERYDVDGVHWAHLRYPGTDGRWGYNPDAVRLFLDTQGQSDGEPDPRGREWVRWRTDRLTALLRRLGETARAARPGVLLSFGAMATGPAPGEGPRPAPPEFEMACQDWPAWCNDGMSDWAVLEDFHVNVEQQERFVRWIDYARTCAGPVRLAAAVSGRLNSDSDVLMQMRLALGRNVAGLVMVSCQEPARGKDATSDLLTFVGKTIYSPDYVLPEYIERVATAPAPAPIPAVASALPLLPGPIALASDLPPPLYLGDVPPPKMSIPMPVSGGEKAAGAKTAERPAARPASSGRDDRSGLSQVDASLALLGIKPGEGKSAATDKPVVVAKSKATPNEGDNAPAEPALADAPWVSVELKGGGKFEAQLVGRDEQNVTLRRFKGRVNVVLPTSRIETIRLIEGHP